MTDIDAGVLSEVESASKPAADWNDVLPPGVDRDAAVNALVRGLEEAHAASAASWSLVSRRGTQYATLDVGPVFAMTVSPNRIAFIFANTLSTKLRAELVDPKPWAGSREFRRVAGIQWGAVTASEFTRLWPQLEASFLDAIRIAAAAGKRSPYARFHRPSAVDSLEALAGRKLPRPDHSKASTAVVSVADVFPALLEMVQRRYPGWAGFDDSRFVADEDDYKRKAVTHAASLLQEGELRDLLVSGQHEEILQRLVRIGHLTNLLFRGVPKKGDLGILYHDDVDQAELSRQVVELLYGSGSSPERLERYATWAGKQGVPAKWTFPTYYLFVTHPEQDILVKPGVANRFLDLIEAQLKLKPQPTAAAYAEFLGYMADLRDALAPYGPRDMVDVQGFLWVALSETGDTTVPLSRRAELESLFDECAAGWFRSAEGQASLAAHITGRAQGLANFRQVVAAHERGEDITELVLSKLLPHADTKGNAESGAWVHVSPVVNKDIRTWFESLKRATPSDWPVVAIALMDLYVRCQASPDELGDAIDDFIAACPIVGMQSGVVTPMLNALNPERFFIVNMKPRHVVNHFTEKNLPQSLDAYPAMNDGCAAVLSALKDHIGAVAPEGAMPADVFDSFCHWLVAVKQYAFSDAKFWKLAPGEAAHAWPEWVEGGYAAIGWGELGDLTGKSKSEFAQIRDRLTAEHQGQPGWTQRALNQVWKFMRMDEGDRIVANRGTTEVVGIGTVTGPYYFVPGTELPHRLPVAWDDTRPRRVNQPSWRTTLAVLGPTELAEVVGSAPQGSTIQPEGGRMTQPRKAQPELVREHAGALYGPRAFELLQGIHDTPRAAYYTEHAGEFAKRIEDPTGALLQEVASRLPQAMTLRLETKHRIMARFVKNDYGRGGAWSFYWGAFYPKGGKRVEDAQLYVWINRERLEFGFSIGAYSGEPKARLLRNIRAQAGVLATELTGRLPMERVAFGEQADFSSPGTSASSQLGISQWLARVEDLGPQIRVVLPPSDVVQLSLSELAEQVSDTFAALYPLVLCTTEPDAGPALLAWFEEQDEAEPQPEYTLAQMAAETGIPEGKLGEWREALNRKGQAVFYGPPGTGKTFIAERMAKHLVAGGDGLVELVQFHPAYAYEDFVQGIRPRVGATGALGFDMVRGRFIDFCERAKLCKGICVLVIDELNRANLSRVFGELMYLLEYRDRSVPLAGGGQLEVPANVRMIGTMNTADRSIALVDHALRRRFAFLHLRPDLDVLRSYLARHGAPDLGQRLAGLLDELNRAINDPGYELGISFFLRPSLADELPAIWSMEIEPYLEEYFFDQPDKVTRYRWPAVRERFGL